MTDIFDLINQEEARQNEQVQLIPSENFVSENVKKALGSCLTNKYAEGTVGKRYYQGNKYIDEIEALAIENGKKLFGVEHLNVQPYSGSPANSAVLMALVNPGDLICGMKLSAGGHLTHGHPGVTFSGKYFNSVQYDVDEEGRIDYDKLEQLVDQNKPKLIFAGGTAYPFMIDWARFRQIADRVGAWLVADISHIAGLCVTGFHPSPNEYVDVITSTTHKILRGPRGAVIGVTKRGVNKNNDLPKLIDKAVFPGLQGGPHMNNIAAMAVAFEEDLQPEYKEYTNKIVANAKALAESLKLESLKVYGTENHLMVVDVGFERGKEIALKLEERGVIVNANTIPHDTASPFRPSGIRIGTPAMTTKGWHESEFEELGKRIAEIIKE